MGHGAWGIGSVSGVGGWGRNLSPLSPHTSPHSPSSPSSPQSPVPSPQSPITAFRRILGLQLVLLLHEKQAETQRDAPEPRAV